MKSARQPAAFEIIMHRALGRKVLGQRLPLAPSPQDIDSLAPIFGFLKFLFRSRNLDADPAQQQLAQLIVEAVKGPRDFNDVLGFLASLGGSRSDQVERLVHAALIVRVWRPDL